MDVDGIHGGAGGGAGGLFYCDWRMVMAGFDRSVVFAHGAYGREANQSDWIAGKDFRIQFGPYFSIRDLKAMQAEGTVDVVFVNNHNSVVWVENL